jgi:hypothetical protein
MIGGIGWDIKGYVYLLDVMYTTEYTVFDEILPVSTPRGESARRGGGVTGVPVRPR